MLKKLYFKKKLEYVMLCSSANFKKRILQNDCNLINIFEIGSDRWKSVKSFKDKSLLIRLQE